MVSPRNDVVMTYVGDTKVSKTSQTAIVVAVVDKLIKFIKTKYIDASYRYSCNSSRGVGASEGELIFCSLPLVPRGRGNEMGDDREICSPTMTINLFCVVAQD